MTTFTFTGLTLNYDPNDDAVVTAVSNTELVIHASGADVAVSYSVLEEMSDGPAGILGQITSGQIFSATFQDTGQSALDADFAVIATAAWGQGNFTTVVVIDNSATNDGQETLIVVAGDPLPEINTPQDWEALIDGVVLGYPQSGPLAPGQVIPLASLGPVVTENGQITGDAGSQDLVGGDGNDVIDGKAGDDQIDGGAGEDTALFSGAQTSYTVSLSAGATLITDRQPSGGDGSDTLQNIELLDFASEIPAFGDGPMKLSDFDGVTNVNAEDFVRIVELYIAYFNRAPDAVGLAFWGNAFAGGLTFEAMAALFIDQDETRATYPSTMTNTEVATAVYNNVLGRVADAEGFDFWVGLLNDGTVGRDTFILAVLEGAKAAPPADATPAFIDQQMTDRQYLSDKTDVGAQFAVHRGMSDVADAASVMALFDGSAASIQNAIDAIEEDYVEALDGTNGDFLLPILGVIESAFDIL